MKISRAILLGISFLAVTALPLAAEESCVTAKCHATMNAVKGVTLHDPVAGGDCSSCHEASGIPHPGKKGGFKFVAEGAALCEQCHDSMSKGKKLVHPALDDGCTSCHNPHLSKHRKLLSAQGSALCTGCHDDPAKGMKSVHPIIADDGCTACHTPHAGDNPKLLLATGQALCDQCHDGLLQGAKVIHSPVGEGDCLSCHDPHASKSNKLTIAAGAALCEQCHVSKSKDGKGKSFPVVHSPVADGDCTACHTPHGSALKGLLTAAGNELCFTCHDDKEKLKKTKNVHPIVADACINCHHPHSGPEKGMLPARGDNLCASCHDDVAKLATTAVSKHGAITDGGCASCHDPHGNGRSKMLTDVQGVLCLGCHDTIMATIATAKSQHQPVMDGDCVACHNPHGAAISPLLNAAFPQSFYAGYNAERYALCFGCHPKGLAEYARTTQTRFSNGDKNLHELHINKSDKGRTCRVCHSVHGADQQRLVRSTSPSFGKWNVPINLQVTETGGTCIVGCHKPKTYDRYRPVSYR